MADVSLRISFKAGCDGFPSFIQLDRQLLHAFVSIETERYRHFVLENQGKGLDAEGLAVLEEDLRSPCTEEIAVFQVFSQIIKEADDHFVIMDTAPTGHTLLLLDATGAYHREMVRQMGQTHDHMVTPMMQLQGPEKTQVIIVTLAETTPVLEAANLQQDLRRADIESWTWVVNNSWRQLNRLHLS